MAYTININNNFKEGGILKDIFVSSIRDEATKIFEIAKEFNLGIEVQGFIQPYLIEDYEEKVQIMKHKLTNIKQCSLHGPFIDLFPASKDPEIVEIVRKRFLQAYNTAKTIGAKHIIFHAGYIHKAYFPEDWLKTSIEFWKDLLCHFDRKIEIHIENVCEDDYLLINELIESVNSSIFSTCLDIGHVNVNSPKAIGEWIKGLNNKIKYVHLHNNDGITDGHYGLCGGEINISNVLELLEVYAPNAKWSLETKLDETEKSILWLEENGFIKR